MTYQPLKPYTRWMFGIWEKQNPLAIRGVCILAHSSYMAWRKVERRYASKYQIVLLTSDADPGDEKPDHN